MFHKKEKYWLSYFTDIGDYKEGYYIGIEVPENDPDIGKLFYGPNVWPPSGKLPNPFKS